MHPLLLGFLCKFKLTGNVTLKPCILTHDSGHAQHLGSELLLQRGAHRKQCAQFPEAEVKVHHAGLARGF